MGKLMPDRPGSYISALQSMKDSKEPKFFKLEGAISKLLKMVKRVYKQKNQYFNHNDPFFKKTLL